MVQTIRLCTIAGSDCSAEVGKDGVKKAVWRKGEKSTVEKSCFTLVIVQANLLEQFNKFWCTCLKIVKISFVLFVFTYLSSFQCGRIETAFVLQNVK